MWNEVYGNPLIGSVKFLKMIIICCEEIDEGDLGYSLKRTDCVEYIFEIIGHYDAFAVDIF